MSGYDEEQWGRLVSRIMAGPPPGQLLSHAEATAFLAEFYSRCLERVGAAGGGGVAGGAHLDSVFSRRAWRGRGRRKWVVVYNCALQSCCYAFTQPKPTPFASLMPSRVHKTLPTSCLVRTRSSCRT